MSRLTYSILLLLFTACAAFTLPPAQHNFVNHETFDESFKNVWKALHSVIDSEGWPVDRAEKETGVLVSKEVPDRLRGGDFGFSQSIDPESATMVVNVRVITVSESRTRVRIHCFFQVNWRLDNKKQLGLGTSRGIVEAHLLKSLRQRLSVSEDR